ncbi:MAG: TolC family protein [Alphaproteobacteria bacterium]|nr:TolC family protein [Alphaproteobacteria bacterium]
MLALLAAAMAVGAGSGRAQSPQSAAPAEGMALTLSEAVFMAVRENPSVRSAHVGRVAQKFALDVAEDMFTPKGALTASIDGSRGTPYYADTTSQPLINRGSALTPTINWMIPTGAQLTAAWGQRLTSSSLSNATNQSNMSVEVRQPLLQGFGSDIAEAPLRAARRREESNVRSLETTIGSTITAVIEAYRSLVQARGALAIGELAVQRAQRLIEINEQLIAAGRMPSQNRIQAEADLARQELSFSRSSQSYDLARLRLVQLLDLPETTRINPTEPMDVKRFRFDLKKVTERAMIKRADLHQAQLAVVDQEEAVKLAEDAGRVKLDLVARGSRWTRETGYYDAFQNSFFVDRPGSDVTAGLQLSVPFWDKQPELRRIQAKTGLEQARIALRERESAARNEVMSAVNTVELSWREWELSVKALDLARQKLDQENVKLSLGRTTNFQVVQYQNDLIAQENAELSSRIAYLNALTSLDRAVGTTLDTWEIKVEAGP